MDEQLAVIPALDVNPSGREMHRAPAEPRPQVLAPPKCAQCKILMRIEYRSLSAGRHKLYRCSICRLAERAMP
jgi:hypothetical protein